MKPIDPDPDEDEQVFHSPELLVFFVLIFLAIVYRALS